MVSDDDATADRSRQQSTPSAKKDRLSKFEGIIISRERVFDVLSTIITAIFTVVLALSTVLLWKETKDLRNFAQQQGEDMKAPIAEAARSASAMRDVAEALTAQTKAVNANLRAYITLGLGGVVPQNRDTGYRYEVRMTVQNVGNTPANNVAFNLYTDLLLVPLPADFKIPAFDLAKAGGTTTVGPHQNWFATAVAPRIYSDDEENELKTGSKKLLYVFGTVTYEDVFGVTRYNKICQLILWMADGKTSSVRNYGTYNESN
jgi:hypothetical protein